MVVVEHHHPEGGLGSAVAAALLEVGVQPLRLAYLSVSELPGSGTTAELLDAAGIDAQHIAKAAAMLVDEQREGGRPAHRLERSVHDATRSR